MYCIRLASPAHSLEGSLNSRKESCFASVGPDLEGHVLSKEASLTLRNTQCLPGIKHVIVEDVPLFSFSQCMLGLYAPSPSTQVSIEVSALTCLDMLCHINLYKPEPEMIYTCGFQPSWPFMIANNPHQRFCCQSHRKCEQFLKKAHIFWGLIYFTVGP